MIDRVGQIRSEEAAEIDGMTTNDDIVLLNFAKDKVAKFVHPLQTICIDRFVANVERHICLLGVNVLKGTNLGGSIHKRGLDGMMSRSNTKCVGISRNLLQTRNDQNLVIGIAGQAFTETASHGTQRPTEAGAQQLGGGCTSITTEDAHELGLLLGPLGRIGRIDRKELGQLIDLRQTKVADGTVKEPTVHLTGEGKVDLIHHSLDQTGNKAEYKDQCRTMMTFIERIIPGGLAAEAMGRW